MNKISDFPAATSTTETDLVYLVQSAATSKISKKISLSTLFSKVFTKIVLPKGVNYGEPKVLVNGDTIDINTGINRLVVTSEGTSFNLPNGVNGDEVILIVPPTQTTFTTTINGYFLAGSSLILNTGSVTRLIFDIDTWYPI